MNAGPLYVKFIKSSIIAINLSLLEISSVNGRRQIESLARCLKSKRKKRISKKRMINQNNKRGALLHPRMLTHSNWGINIIKWRKDIIICGMSSQLYSINGKSKQNKSSS